MQATRRSDCPVACALDLAGDRWTLLVVRDLLRGRHTYKELQSGGEGIPTNILADRLKKMEDNGLVCAQPYQDNPVRWRYELTPKGEELGAVLGALARWGKKHIRGTRVASEFRVGLRPRRSSSAGRKATSR